MKLILIPASLLLLLQGCKKTEHSINQESSDYAAYEVKAAFREKMRKKAYAEIEGAAPAAGVDYSIAAGKYEKAIENLRSVDPDRAGYLESELVLDEAKRRIDKTLEWSAMKQKEYEKSQADIDITMQQINDLKNIDRKRDLIARFDSIYVKSVKLYGRDNPVARASESALKRLNEASYDEMEVVAIREGDLVTAAENEYISFRKQMRKSPEIINGLPRGVSPSYKSEDKTSPLYIGQ